MNFNNKTIVITGGATGIGATTAQLFSSYGASVYVLDIAPLSYEAKNISLIPCDVTNFDAIEQAIKQVLKLSSKIDCLFANAGIHVAGNIENTTVETIDRVLTLNFKSIFLTLKCVLPQMKAQGHGSIVLMGSDQSFIGKPNNAIYGATKAAIAQLTKSAAIDYAPFNIRVNCVCPGTVETPLYHEALDLWSANSGIPKQTLCENLAKLCPMQRIGQPEEIAQVVAFLCSDNASFINGALIPIDGGYTAQ